MTTNLVPCTRPTVQWSLNTKLKSEANQTRRLWSLWAEERSKWRRKAPPETTEMVAVLAHLLWNS